MVSKLSEVFLGEIRRPRKPSTNIVGIVVKPSCVYPIRPGSP